MPNPEFPRTPLRTRASACPVCGRPATPDSTPFCGQGCRDRDLLQWLGEGYRIPARPAENEDDEGLERGSDGGLDNRAVRPL